MECFSCVHEAALIYCNYYDHSGPGNESNDKIGPCDEKSDKCDIKQGEKGLRADWMGLKMTHSSKTMSGSLELRTLPGNPCLEIRPRLSSFFSISFYFYCLFTVTQLLCGKSDLTEQHVHSFGSRQKARQSGAPEGTQAAATTLAEQSSHLKPLRLESWATSWSFRTETRFPHYTAAPIRITGVQRVCGATSHGAFSSTSAVLALLRSRLRNGGTTSPFQQIAAPRCFDWRFF